MLQHAYFLSLSSLTPSIPREKRDAGFYSPTMFWRTVCQWRCKCCPSHLVLPTLLHWGETPAHMVSPERYTFAARWGTRQHSLPTVVRYCYRLASGPADLA